MVTYCLDEVVLGQLVSYYCVWIRVPDIFIHNIIKNSTEKKAKFRVLALSPKWSRVGGEYNHTLVNLNIKEYRRVPCQPIDNTLCFIFSFLFLAETSSMLDGSIVTVPLQKCSRKIL